MIRFKNTDCFSYETIFEENQDEGFQEKKRRPTLTQDFEGRRGEKKMMIVCHSTLQGRGRE